MPTSHSDKATLALVKRYETTPNAYYEAEEFDIICEHYVRMAQLQKALKASQQGLDFHQHYPPLYYHMARSYMELGKLDDAKTIILRAIQINRRIVQQTTKKLSSNFYLHMYDTYLLKAEICLKRKELGNATRAMNQAMQLPIKFRYSPYIDMAQLYNDADLPILANKCCQKACEDTPNDSAAWNLLCHSYFQINKPKLAIKALKKLIELNPYDATSWVRLGTTYAEMGMPIEAENAYSYAIHIDEDYFDAWYNFALLHLENDAFERAFSCLENCNRLYPDQLLIQLNMVICERHLNRYQQAIDRCTLLLKKHPNHTDVLTELGTTYFHFKKWDSAIAVFESILSSKNKAIALTFLSKIHHELNHIDTAIDYIQQAIETEPLPTRWAWLSNLYLFQEAYDKSLQAMFEVERIDPYFPFLDLHIAIIYQALNNTQQAKKHIKIAVQKAPESIRLFVDNFPASKDYLDLSDIL